MTTTLYYSPGACSLAPHILLEEIGAEYTLIEVNDQQGKTQEAEFLKLNPKGRVPVLCTESRVLTEVTAICWKIGFNSSGSSNRSNNRKVRSGDATSLIPADSFSQAQALEWFNWLSGTLHGIAFGGKWRPQRFVTDQNLHEAVKAKADENLRDGFAHIERRLANLHWALGDDYSIVDPYLFVFYRWTKAIGIDVSQTYPAWHAHAMRMLARPAVKRALAQEGLQDMSA